VKLSFNSWVFASFPAWLPAWPLEEVVDRLADAGYDGIEIGAAAPHAYPDYLDADRRRAIVAHLERRGLEVSSICPALGGGPGFNPASPDAPERAAALAYAGACVDLAADLGCPRVIWLGGWRQYGQTHADAWALSVENLRRCAEAAERRGVRLVVEPTPADSNLVEQVGDALRIIDEAGVDAGVMIDTYHVFHRDDEIGDTVRAAGSRLEHVHVSDEGRDAPGTHRDFTTLVRELRAAGYGGWLSMEVGFNRREPDPVGLVRDSIAHLRGVLAAEAA
jgi:protein FrlC